MKRTTSGGGGDGQPGGRPTVSAPWPGRTTPCAPAAIPEDAQDYRSKTAMAPAMVATAQRRGKVELSQVRQMLGLASIGWNGRLPLGRGPRLC